MNIFCDISCTIIGFGKVVLHGSMSGARVVTNEMAYMGLPNAATA